MDSAEPIDKIRARAQQCRRLASFSSDRQVSKTLMQMAEEAETEIRRMEAQRDRG